MSGKSLLSARHIRKSGGDVGPEEHCGNVELGLLMEETLLQHGSHTVGNDGDGECDSPNDFPRALSLKIRLNTTPLKKWYPVGFRLTKADRDKICLAIARVDELHR